MSSLRVLRDWVPPRLLPLARRIAAMGRPEWLCLGARWPPVPPSEGWTHPSIVEVEMKRWERFVEAVETPRPLRINHEAAKWRGDDLIAHNVVVTFLYIVALAAQGQCILSVLDWGGGIGHYYLFSRAAVPEMELDYTVKELPSFCEAGRKVLPAVKFVSTEEEAFSRKYHLVVASSSLWYAPDWRGLLRRLADVTEGYLYITRMVFVDISDSYVALQRPSLAGYMTEYATWIMNRREFVEAAQAANLEPIREFLLGPGPYVYKAPEQGTYGGFLLGRGARLERRSHESR